MNPTKQNSSGQTRPRDDERLLQLFEQSPGFMANLRGPQHVYELVNSAWRQLIGERDVIGKPFHEASPEVKGQGFHTLLDRVYATGIARSRQAMQVSYQPRAGAALEHRFIDFVVQALRDHTGLVDGLCIQGIDVSARVLAEQRLSRAQQAGGVGTFTLGLADNQLHGTPEFFRIFGLGERQSASATELEALVLPEDASLRSASVTRGNQTAPLDVEYRIRRANDGELRWIARRAEYERDANGVTVAMVGAVLDITERKAAQAAIEDSAEQFRTLAQALPNHVWTAPANGQLDWCNDRIYQYSGASPGELDGAGWTGMLHPDDVAQASERWVAALNSGETYEFEFRLKRADGSYRWHLTRALPLRNADGAIKRWVGTNTDIHERKLAEARSTRDLNRIWSLSQELMLVCDFDGNIDAVNPSAMRILDWTESEMLGKSLSDFVHPQDMAATTAECALLACGAPTASFENRYRARDGSYRLLNWTAVPDGTQIHAVARDITRERLAEESLRQSQKMEAVGQLTGGVAHDFNNLLSIIRTSVELMRRAKTTEDRRKHFMTSILRAVDRATKLTSQLLAFARRQALQPVDFDAAANVRSVSEMIFTLVGARISVEVVADKSCPIHADPSQFDTAIVNMAVNARDAMDGSGRMVIDVRSTSKIPQWRTQAAIEGDFIAISLSDTGSGIEDQYLDKIFEPFFTTKSVGLGTGLGLSQVFGFAKQSGGEVRVESEPGRGSTFVIYLPRAAALQCEPDTQEAESDHEAIGRGARVLVVEDNPELAASVAETLHELGFRSTVVDSAEAGLAELAGKPEAFDLIFSDVVMAGMNGIEMANEIRRRHPRLPIVLSSGYSEVLTREYDHGFDLLPKPYSLDALSSVLQTAMARQAPRSARVTTSIESIAASFADRSSRQEQSRQLALDQMLVIDSEEEAAYDDLTRMAAALFEAPIALISLIDRDRQWFKSRIGLQIRQTPREHAFCARAIQQPEQVMVVGDASKDLRFRDNPLVTGDPNLRFYAGAPLVTEDGHALGTICVLDPRAREVDHGKLEMLQALAKQVVRRMEKRRRERAHEQGS